MCKQCPRHIFSFAFIAAGITLLSSCNPGPKYVRPPAPAPTAFKEAIPSQYKEGEGWKLAEPSDDKIRGKWWEMYNDPQLNALEEQIQISNQSIVQVEANFRSARASITSARASLLPLVTASTSYTNSRFSQTARTTAVVASAAGPGPGATTSSGTTTTSSGGSTTTTSGTGATSTTTGVVGSGNIGAVNTFSLPIDLSYTVDLWHRVRNTIAANAFTAQASAADIATAVLSTRAEVADDYFEVRALDAQRAILNDTLENYRRALDLTKTLFNTGIDSDEDVAQAQTQIDTA